MRLRTHADTNDSVFRFVMDSTISGTNPGILTRTITRARVPEGRLAPGQTITLADGREFVITRMEIGPALVPISRDRYAWESVIAVLPLSTGPALAEDADLAEDDDPNRPFARPAATAGAR